MYTLRMPNPLRVLSALAAVVLATSACGLGGSDDMFSAADDAAAPDAVETDAEAADGTDGATDGATAAEGAAPVGFSGRTGTFGLNDSDLTDDEVAEAVGAYQEFLDAKNRFRVDQELTADDELTVLAASGIVAELGAWRDQGVQADEDFDVEVLERRSQANVKNVVGDNGRLLLHDCLEEEEDRETFGTPLTSATIVDQIITMSNAGTGWVVQDIDVRHSGGIDSSGLGCVPDYHLPRLEAFLDDFHGEIAAMQADPAGGVSDALASYVNDDQRDALVASVEQRANDGFVVREREAHTYEVLGTAPEYGNRSFVVAVCGTYPDGAYARDPDTGDVVEGEGSLEPGSQIYREVVVTSLPDDNGGFTNRVVDIVNPAQSC